MSDNTVHLLLAVFDSTDGARTAAAALSRAASSGFSQETSMISVRKAHSSRALTTDGRTAYKIL